MQEKKTPAEVSALGHEKSLREILLFSVQELLSMGRLKVMTRFAQLL